MKQEIKIILIPSILKNILIKYELVNYIASFHQTCLICQTIFSQLTHLFNCNITNVRDFHLFRIFRIFASHLSGVRRLISLWSPSGGSGNQTPQPGGGRKIVIEKTYYLQIYTNHTFTQITLLLEPPPPLTTLLTLLWGLSVPMYVLGSMLFSANLGCITSEIEC